MTEVKARVGQIEVIPRYWQEITIELWIEDIGIMDFFKVFVELHVPLSIGDKVILDSRYKRIVKDGIAYQMFSSGL
jgi:hypothetical protein